MKEVVRRYARATLVVWAMALIATVLWGCEKTTDASVAVKQASDSVQEMDSIRHDLAFKHGIVISMLSASPTHDTIEIADQSLNDLLTIRSRLQEYTNLGQNVLAIASRKDVKSSSSTRTMIVDGLADAKEWQRTIDLRILDLQNQPINSPTTELGTAVE